MGKTSKVMAGITSTALMLGIAGCGTNSDSYTDASASADNNSYSSSNFDSSTATNYDSSTNSSVDADTSSNLDTDTSTNVDFQSEEDLPPMPDDPNCTDWEWDQEDAVWQCTDSGSGYYGHSFYGGHYYSDKSLLYGSKDYMAYKSSNSFKGGSSTSGGTSSNESDSVTRSSGFGNGSKSFGG